VGNGQDDLVHFVRVGSNVTITLGNGDGDQVYLAFAGSAPGPVVTLGNGNGDQVTLLEVVGAVINVGNGTKDIVNLGDVGDSKINVGSGNYDMVLVAGSGNTITVGNGIGVQVDVSSDLIGNTVTVGNGGDTIKLGLNDTVTLGRGADNVVLRNDAGFLVPNTETINHFDTKHDVITIPTALATDFSKLTLTDVKGNTVITFPNDAFDQIVLVGVHSSALHQSDFQFMV
jgi:hypothetical protein